MKPVFFVLLLCDRGLSCWRIVVALLSALLGTAEEEAFGGIDLYQEANGGEGRPWGLLATCLWQQEGDGCKSQR